jgi:type IV secretion system protein TrbI
MSEEQKIDPALLEDESPTGMELRGKPRGIKKINAKGVAILAGVVTVAGVVATLTFNQAGKGVSTSVQQSIANQGQTTGQGDVKRDNLWYANVPDHVATATAPDAAAGAADTPGATQGATGAPAGQGAAAPQGGNAGRSTPAGVPNLEGQAKSPLEAATAQKVATRQLNGSGGAGGQAQEDPMVQQSRAQAAQRQDQALQQALAAGLVAPGFTKTGAAGGMSAPTMGAGMAAQGGGLPAGVNPAALAAAAAGGRGDEDPNKQGRKDQFLESAKVVDPAYSPSMKTAPRGQFEVKAGSIIPAVMISGINSDLPGQVNAQVRENVWDTKTGKYLLIPQGSRLIGLYDAHVAYGQQRVLLAWSRIIYPDGSSFDLKGMPGADRSGYAGFFDQVDNHYTKIFGSAVLMSLISAGVQLSQPNNGTSGTNQAPSVSSTVGAALGQQIGQTAMTITQKNINIQPTLEIRPGYRFNVMVTADMILPPVGQ